MNCLNDLQKYSLQTCPLRTFELWFKKALEKEENPSAFSLATSSKDGTPSVRYLLFKGLRDSRFCFFTHKQSPKAKDFKENPKAAMAFYWHNTGKQVRISGTVEEMPSTMVQDYCQKRPRLSKVATFISKQSQQIFNKEDLLNEFDHCLKKFEGKEIPVPPHWGGYYIKPLEIEFFVYGEHRLNDRFLYKKEDTEHSWNIKRLAP